MIEPSNVKGYSTNKNLIFKWLYSCRRLHYVLEVKLPFDTSNITNNIVKNNKTITRLIYRSFRLSFKLYLC